MNVDSKRKLDTTGGLWFNGKLVNKVVSAMTSAQNPHGGQEQTILSLYTTMYHWGAIVALHLVILIQLHLELAVTHMKQVLLLVKMEK